MVLVRTLTGHTLNLDISPEDNVLSIKSKIAACEGIPIEDQRLILAGHQLSDDEQVEDFSTLHLALRLLGGAKKRKKKVYTTPKKIKHKRKKVKLAVLKYYECAKHTLIPIHHCNLNLHGDGNVALGIKGGRKFSGKICFNVDENGKIRRLRVECQSPSCGGGVFMAAHENRYYCGRCHDTLVVQEPVASSKAKGGKGKK